MAILIANKLLETETEAWYTFYVDKFEDIKDLPTSKSTGSSYKVKKFAKPASIAYCIEMAAQYALDDKDEWRLLYALRSDVADAILKNVEEIKRLVANTSASEQAAASSASAANASAIAASKSEKISTENASAALASERASRDCASDAKSAEGNALISPDKVKNNGFCVLVDEVRGVLLIQIQQIINDSFAGFGSHTLRSFVMLVAIRTPEIAPAGHLKCNIATSTSRFR